MRHFLSRGSGCACCGNFIDKEEEGRRSCVCMCICVSVVCVCTCICVCTVHSGPPEAQLGSPVLPDNRHHGLWEPQDDHADPGQVP